MKRDGRRMALGLGAAILALAMGAQPAFAETVIHENGTIGYYQVKDHAGANCIYDHVTYNLDKITVRAPTVVHGHYSSKTWVGWEFKILRSTDFGSTFHTYYTSSVQKAKANDSLPASGFTRMTWNAPTNPTGFFLVRVDILWYAKGSTTNVEGDALVEYDNYKLKHDSDHMNTTDWCLEDY